MVKYIDLSVLPKNKNRINWLESVGCKCKFRYDDIEGCVEIIRKKEKDIITIKYNEREYDITTYNLRKCCIGVLLNKRTNKFKVEVGKIFKDNKRDITVIDKKYKPKKRPDGTFQNFKYYNYKCNKCGNEDWIEERKLLVDKNGCNACCHNPQKIVLGINTIWDTDRWMTKIGVSEKDAKRYTHSSTKTIKVKCPKCNKEKNIRIYDIYESKSIRCICGDGISYPEKFITSLLDQLNINYTREFSPKWANNKKYDFYFLYNGETTIIETHGKQHYIDTLWSTAEVQHQNDIFKEKLAINHNIKNYIIINCSLSDIQYIKQNIEKTKLSEMFDLTKIDWQKCEEFALSNKIKEVCDYWKLIKEIKKENITMLEMSNFFNLDKHTIWYYLKKGSRLGWCNYMNKEVIK